ncbi:MAG: VCBS repeat-containing protein, partial [Verrucomicrobiaceae bacterium]
MRVKKSPSRPPPHCGVPMDSRRGHARGSFAASPLSGAAGPATAQALADLDGDGDIDVLIGGASGIITYLNDGRGNLVPQAAPFGSANPVAIALASVTASGGTDAIVATAAGDLQVWSNSGSGTFTLASTVANRLHPRALAVGDLDSDGDLDIFAAGTSGNAVYLNDGSGHFTAPSSTFAAVGSPAGVSVVLGDVNQDGSLDVLAAHRSTTDSSTRTVLWLNRGNGIFDEKFADLPGADRVEIADLTGDGLPDLVTSRELGPTQVFKNLGSGNFQALGIELGGGTATLATGDVDGDGSADLVLTNAVGQLGTWTGSSLELEADQPPLSFGNRAE